MTPHNETRKGADSIYKNGRRLHGYIYAKYADATDLDVHDHAERAL